KLFRAAIDTVFLVAGHLHRSAGIRVDLELTVEQIEQPVRNDSRPCINARLKPPIDSKRCVGGFEHERYVLWLWRAIGVIVQRFADDCHVWLRLTVEHGNWLLDTQMPAFWDQLAEQFLDFLERSFVL